MCKEVLKVLMFGNIEIEKNKFYHHKTPTFVFFVGIWGGRGIEKVLVSNNIPFIKKNYKNFIGYLYNDHKVKPLHMMLPKASSCVKSYEEKT